jgi:hypothetical protein
MANLLIGFRSYEAKKNIETTLMSWGLNHEIIHCELFFTEYLPHQRFSSWNGSGVGFREFSTQQMGDIAKWNFYDLGTERYDYALFYAQSLQGKGYDLKTAIMSSMGLTTNEVDAFFCSEICANVMQEVGYNILNVSASIILPHELEVMVSPQFPSVQLNDYIR